MLQAKTQWVAALSIVMTVVLAVPAGAAGPVVWGRRYNGTGNSYDGGQAIKVSPDGKTVFVTGYSVGTGGNNDYLTNVYRASDGATLWGRRYNGTGHASDIAIALAVSPDGKTVFVTGVSVGSGTGDDYVTNVYRASDGATLWGRRYNGTGNAGDGASAISVSPDGKSVFVTGYSRNAGGRDDVVTNVYRASDGMTTLGSPLQRPRKSRRRRECNRGEP